MTSDSSGTAAITASPKTAIRATENGRTRAHSESATGGGTATRSGAVTNGRAAESSGTATDSGTTTVTGTTENRTTATNRRAENATNYSSSCSSAAAGATRSRKNAIRAASRAT